MTEKRKRKRFRQSQSKYIKLVNKLVKRKKIIKSGVAFLKKYSPEVISHSSLAMAYCNITFPTKKCLALSSMLDSYITALIAYRDRVMDQPKSNE